MIECRECGSEIEGGACSECGVVPGEPECSCGSHFEGGACSECGKEQPTE